MEGKNFLKVTGILMIIFGAIGLIAGIMTLIGSGFIESAGLGGAVNNSYIKIPGILQTASGIAEIIAGIFGIKFCQRPERAPVCLTLGLIVLILALAGVVLNAILYNASVITLIVSIICSIVIPIIYIIGALKNRRAA